MKVNYGDKWLVAGLGNPGSEFEHTRHNVGRDAAALYKQTCRQGSPGDMLGSVEVMLPETFMNLSGGPVAKALGKDKAERIRNAERLIVVHDDIDLPFGEIKVSKGSGSGGQKGVESIIKAIGTKDFVRVRIGIVPVFLGKPRKPKGSRAVSSFVLKKFGILERNELPNILSRAGEAITEIIEHGHQRAMNKFN